MATIAEPNAGHQSPTKFPVATPRKSPVKRSTMIAQRQKQALLDNLQHEITQRARKLRAQYGVQAQSLRTRTEMRINRIPAALRKATMGELFAKYEEKPTPQATSIAIAAQPNTEGAQAAKRNFRPQTEAASLHTKGLKRKSDEISGNDDKENTPDPSLDMPAPKKRTKPAGPTSRANPSTVLSPKSSNSRTLPRVSPAKPTSDKPTMSRPASPLKPPLIASPSKGQSVVAAATESLARLAGGGGRPRAAKAPAAASTTATTRKASKPAPEAKPATATATRGKRAAAAATTAVSRAAAATTRKETRNVSNSTVTSAASGTSTGTTIVRRPAGRPAATASNAATAAAGRRNAAATGAAAGGRKAPTKKEGGAAAAKVKAEAAPAPARRVLRKRA